MESGDLSITRDHVLPTVLGAAGLLAAAAVALGGERPLALTLAALACIVLPSRITFRADRRLGWCGVLWTFARLRVLVLRRAPLAAVTGVEIARET